MNLVTRNTPRLMLAIHRSEQMGVPMDIAVVDDGGHLLAFARMDGAKLSSIDIAPAKAVCAATRRQPSGAAAGVQVNLALSLGISVASRGRQIPVRGGVPLMVDGVCVGAIGVSNGSEDQDTEVAQAGAGVLEKA